MGDGGELYRSVPQEMVQLYRTTVFPLADVVFPNQTEIEYVLNDFKLFYVVSPVLIGDLAGS
jgi:pyridoxal/pyridoxine/pyridoxamine kinase